MLPFSPSSAQENTENTVSNSLEGTPPVNRRVTALSSSTTKSKPLPASSASSAFSAPAVVTLTSSPNTSSQGNSTWSPGDWVAYNNSVRVSKRESSLVKMQTFVRGFVARRQFKRVLETVQEQRAAAMVQKIVRGIVARKQVKAMIIQKIEIDKIRQEKIELELDMAKAERIRALRNARIIEQCGTGKVSISEVYPANGHIRYKLTLELYTTTEAQGETKNVTTGVMTEITSSTRYSVVHRLDSLLHEYEFEAPFTMPIMPPKTWSKKPTNMNFLTRRKEHLNIYLNQLLSNPTIVESWPMRHFLDRLRLNAVPNNTTYGGLLFSQ